MDSIPEKINNYNIYMDGRLMGCSGEVTLPDFEAMTETISGPGLLGEYESNAIGHFSSMEIEIPFRVLDGGVFKLANQRLGLNLTLRGAEQCIDPETCDVVERPIRIVLRGRNKGLTEGKLKPASAMDSSVKLEILYILIEINKKPKIELDKLNFVFNVDGKDMLKKVREYC